MDRAFATVRPIVRGARWDDAHPDGVAAMISAAAPQPSARTAVLKLNLCDYRAGSSGATTSLGFTSHVVRALRAACPSLDRIVLLDCDSSGTRVADLYPLLGFSALARELDCELFDPSASGWRHVDDVHGLPIDLPDLVFDADLLVNVPKMKSHATTAYTGALKNNFGLVRRKWKIPYHEHLDETIIACNRHLPRQLVVVDGGTVPSGPGSSFGVAFRPGVALVSWDPVAADAAGARMIGVPPGVVRHLRMAHREGLGSRHARVEWLDAQRPRERPPFRWSRFVASHALRRR
jgi:uncharacterized protein (DUF362 family)